MIYSQAIAQEIENYFKESKYSYTKNETANGECIFTLRTKLRCKLQICSELIIVRDNNISVIASIPLAADENHRLAVAEYLTRANFNLRTGNFELNMLDGEIRFKNYAPFFSEEVSSELIKQTILFPFLMFERFSDGLLAVLFDISTPKEAFDALPK